MFMIQTAENLNVWDMTYYPNTENVWFSNPNFKSLLDSGQPLVDVFEIFLNSFDVFRKFGLSLAQKLLIVAQTDL
jgi:hypothetical protein